MGQDLPPVGGYEPVQYKVYTSLPIVTFQLRHEHISLVVTSFTPSLTSTIQAQPPRSRLSTSLLPSRHGRHHDLWVLQGRQGNSRAKVRCRSSNVVSSRVYIRQRLTMITSELAREKMWSRIYLIPVLQAEEDRDLVRRYYADKARERALLGSETSVYNSDRCVQSIFPVVANSSLTTCLARRRG